MITIGSLFSGIGGFELGLERAIPNAKTIWQCEQSEFCRKVLRKHWPDSIIYEDITKMDTKEVPYVDLMCGGFPCQDISVAGKGVGIYGKKSGLWWYMHATINRLRPTIIVLENVPAITFRGGAEVVRSITDLGYGCEWGIISASQFGAPHLRKRWFLIAYTDSMRCKKRVRAGAIKKKNQHHKIDLGRKSGTSNYWSRFPTESPICGRNDGVSHRVDRIKALGNAIVPQCSEYIGNLIKEAGLL